jgi:hypothetical protein
MTMSNPATHTNAEISTKDRSSILAASAWMVVLSLLLFFLPLINGVIGGLVGGYKVGSVGRALLAAILPAVLVALGLWLLLAVVHAPFWGIVAGLTGATLVLFADLGIFIGAIIGGALASR